MTSTQAPKNERYQTASWVSSYRAETPAEEHGCDCCGQGLLNINLFRLADGEIVALGNDCAERVGLDDAALKAWWREKFAEQRWAAQRARWATADAEDRAKATGLPQVPELIAYYQAAQAEHERRGGIGDVTTNGAWDGIFADYANEAVTVGQLLATGQAVRAVRIQFAAEQMAAFVRAPFRGGINPASLGEGPALYDLDGNLVDARWVEGAYGMVWRIEGAYGVEWFNPSKARNEDAARRNNAKKGYYVGSALYLSGRDRNRRFYLRYDVPPVVILDNGLPLD